PGRPVGPPSPAALPELAAPVRPRRASEGIADSYDMVSMVPKKLAGQVEVHVRPATYRVVEDEPVQDILKKAAEQKDPVQDQVLRFRR
ncbi:hypothetical protein, partial [Streptosporangium sp. NPDC048865]|uniref:hypothetical protein n=1 Tax=Streptosporangium sp. NPDC048865 TaxID=3155766 RepID=UPI0034247EF5